MVGVIYNSMLEKRRGDGFDSPQTMIGLAEVREVCE